YRVVPLEGVITYNGEALEGVVLEFFVEDYRPSGAMVRPGGRFQAVHTQSTDGVPVGTVTMRIAWPGGHDHAPPPAYVPLLAKYGIDSEGYVFELTRGDKNFRIDLE
ncbi:MAG: hypothetical protein FWG73_09600, partial [Planctomycetaceae bacterium]|nr:hypothetical protein [Planctomycetaceae bacterium]